jgi:uncharacterized membrane protein YdjX (TVP38/TMEM64 family)
VRLLLLTVLVCAAVAALAIVRVSLPFDDGVFFEGVVLDTSERVTAFAPSRPLQEGSCAAEAQRRGARVVLARARGGHALPDSGQTATHLRVGDATWPALRCDPLPRGFADRAWFVGPPRELPEGAGRRGRLLYMDGSQRIELRLARVLFEDGGSRTLADAFRQFVDRTGAFGPAVFVAAFVVATILAFPATVLTVAGAMGFGLWAGFFWVWLGANLGAVAAFCTGRYLGRDFVARRLPARFAALDSRISARGFVSVLFMRLLPVLPFLAVNYACGVSAIRLRDFVLGTALGTVPILFLFVYAASTAWRMSLSEPATWLPLLAALPVLATPWLWRHVWRVRAHGPK